MDLENHDQQHAGNDAAAGGAGIGVTRGVPETQGARTALRRRFVLGGLVAVPTVLTVMKPVKTLAKSKKKKACSYSGWHSFKLNANTSAQPNKGKKCKSGFTQKFFYSKAKKKLPKNSKKGNSNSQYNKIYNHSNQLVTIYQNTTFSSLFGSGSSSSIMSILAGGSTTYSAFLTALFNAYWLNGSGYPYTCAQIYSLWGQTSNQANIALFLQQLDSFS